MADNGYSVLIVDDSATTRMVIKRTITLSQVPISRFVEAADGAAALAALRIAPVDVVFADINMPIMTGIELTRSMKKDPLLQNIPVVVVSSESMEKKIEGLRVLGIAGYIKKPFTPEQIRQKINELLPSKAA